MNVNYVIQHLGMSVIFKDMKELTLERNPKSVKYVVQHLGISVIFENMKELTHEKHSINVKYAVKPTETQKDSHYGETL